jgi:hypothetical protein
MHFAKVSLNKRDNLHLKYLLPILMSVLLMLTIQLLSLIINSPLSKRAPLDILVYFITFYGPILMLIVSYTIVNVFNDVVGLIRIFITIILLSVIASFLFAVSENLFGFVRAPVERIYIHRFFIPRLSITGLALILSVGLPLILSMFLFTKKKGYIVLFIAAVTALLFTCARWNIIVGIATMSLYYIILLKMTKGSTKIWKVYSKKIFTLVCFLIILLTMLSLLGIIDMEWIKFLLGNPDAIVDRSSSITNRTMALIEAWSFFCERPFLGYGPGEIYVRALTIAKYGIASSIVNDFRFLTPYSITLGVPHSTFASTLAEGGIVSFIAFLLIIRFLISKQANNLKMDGSFKVIGIGLFSCSFAFIFSMLFNSIEHAVEPWILFWFIQGIGMGLYKLRGINNLNSDYPEPA